MPHCEFYLNNYLSCIVFNNKYCKHPSVRVSGRTSEGNCMRMSEINSRMVSAEL